MEILGATNDSFNNIIMLHGDPMLTFRYHCCSVTGVHTALLPWVTRLSDHFQMESEEAFELQEVSVV